ncbi:PREDICTED: RING-H2 finger protein ATL78 isoform X3 [Brassica oleracea var. oleracea]|uniref:RING-H2 finger protein ATL78 isoform X3 n=1 Tax=Brassica oleracea var. oleracea TaxID=109376 RepID=UPI0006A6E625|nr:PREDICTED: RING-H2 finger protein ATL78 isoform X3 [Brassica oleracea var. oleracea]
MATPVKISWVLGSNSGRFDLLKPHGSNCLAPSEADNNQTAARMTNTGVKREALKSFQTISYAADLNIPGLDTECVICLSEFVSEERVKLLPTCHHGFHVRCIDKWLSSHSSCPTCRHCLVETCQKIADCSQTRSLNPPQPPQDSIIVQIAPLQPERWIRCFRNRATEVVFFLGSRGDSKR